MQKITAGLIAFTLLSSTAPVFAKVITLDCEFVIEANNKFRADLTMDTANQTASATRKDRKGEPFTLAGKLFTDGSQYWFTGKSDATTNKYQIDRNNLKAIFSQDLGGFIPKPIQGQCEVVEKAQPKI